MRALPTVSPLNLLSLESACGTPAILGVLKVIGISLTDTAELFLLKAYTDRRLPYLQTLAKLVRTASVFTLPRLTFAILGLDTSEILKLLRPRLVGF